MNKWEDLLESGMQLERAGDWSGAAAKYRTAVEADAENADGWFRLGVVSLKAHKYDDAAAIFRSLTLKQPEFGEAWSNLGAALASTGKHPEAEEVFRKATTLCPKRADLWRNLGSVQAALGLREQAIASLRSSLEIEASSSAALILLAKLLRSAGRPREAVQLLSGALELQPALYECRVGLAEVLAEVGETEEAVLRLNQARNLRPDLPGAYLGLGAILAERGQYDSAETLFRRAIAVDPHSAEAFANLGNLLRLTERAAESEASLLEALRLNSKHAGACFNYGILLEQRGALNDAVRYYSIAATCHSGRAEHHIDLGRALESLGRNEDAIAAFRRAAELKPDSVEYLNTLGLAQVRNGAFDQAKASFERALSMQPNYAEAHYSLATLHLLVGNWSEGWQELEWRWQAKGYSSRSFRQPLWGGEPLAGRTILVHSEQGLGDTLQFVRYIALVQRLGGVVVFECQAALLELLSNCSGIDRIVAAGQPLPDFDLHIPLLSLPRVLRTTVSTVPCDVPYIAADPKRVEEWQLRFSAEQIFRVGVVWRGNPKFNRDANRSLKLTLFEPLARLPGVRLFSLQKGAATEELQQLGGRFPIEDLGSTLDEGCGAFVDTAALMKNLNLVISIDSSPAHLAGALGVPVWVPLAAAADWRWLLEREDTPWYPTMRLFRRQHTESWEAVVGRMAQELNRILAADRFRASSTSRVANTPSIAGATELAAKSYLRDGIEAVGRGNLFEATQLFRSAISSSPACADAHSMLGSAQLMLGHNAEAIDSLMTAIRLNPRQANDLNHLGVAFVRQDKLEEAGDAFSRAVSIQPSNFEAQVNLGGVHYRQGNWVEAAKCYRRAVELRPEAAEAHCNLGIALGRLGTLDEAIRCYETAIQLTPDYADAHHNLAQLKLALGDWATGWKELEWRWKCGPAKKQPFTRPLWNGGSMEAGTILLHCEQGLGDSIQFIRYAPLVKKLVGTVILGCPSSLKRLFHGCVGIDRMISGEIDSREYDVHAPLMSLPGILATRPNHVPGGIPYIFAESERVEFWKRRLPDVGKFRIGIVWRGNPKHPCDCERSSGLAAFEPLAGVPNVSLISLQKGAGTRELESATRVFPVHELGDDLDSHGGAFLDAAAVMKNLDLVVSVDSAPAHLAGALGVPIWLVLPHTPDWRWLLKTESTPWYPTMRLFRQSRPGDWNDVFQRVARALIRQNRERFSGMH